MDLWETKNGDQWFCEECAKQSAHTIYTEKWRPVLRLVDPELHCSRCGLPDAEQEE